jgi:FkbM family methyltransferase
MRNSFSYLLIKIQAALGMTHGRFRKLQIPIYSKTWKFLFKEIFLAESYHFESSNPNPTIIDCGANVGFSTLYFKSIYPNSKVICFEASKETFDKLEKTLEKNNIHGVVAEQVALSNREVSEVEFYRNSTDDNDLGSALRPSGVGSSEKVKTRKLSSYINSEIDFLKLDVEGEETAVIEDLVTSGKIHNIKTGLIEFHLNNDHPSNNLATLLKYLSESGFGYRFTACSKMHDPWRYTQAILIDFKKIKPQSNKRASQRVEIDAQVN